MWASWHYYSEFVQNPASQSELSDRAFVCSAERTHHMTTCKTIFAKNVFAMYFEFDLVLLEMTEEFFLLLPAE